jgi:cell division protease FtsH
MLGTVAYGENQEEVFLGHSVARSQNVSEETARIIDSEVKRIVGAGWDEARKILTDKAGDLEKLAQALLEYETLSGRGDQGPAREGAGPEPRREQLPQRRPVGLRADHPGVGRRRSRGPDRPLSRSASFTPISGEVAAKPTD